MPQTDVCADAPLEGYAFAYLDETTKRMIRRGLLKAVAIPAVEVHISAVETREDFRQVSYARLACFATITGEGLQGYAHALELLKEHLEK